MALHFIFVLAYYTICVKIEYTNEYIAILRVDLIFQETLFIGEKIRKQCLLVQERLFSHNDGAACSAKTLVGDTSPNP